MMIIQASLDILLAMTTPCFNNLNTLPVAFATLADNHIEILKNIYALVNDIIISYILKVDWVNLQNTCNYLSPCRTYTQHVNAQE